MADVIEINMRTLEQDISEMQQQLAELRQEMDQAYSSVRELDSMWNGPANEAFNQAFTADKEAMESMCSIIESLISYMENAKKEYQKCEAAVSAEIDSIRI
ncbi:MAG: WXG100 family type VII secretion target [Monoglobales bacterium]|uniref:WXG100 family type VII secretion target n=1 Tax=Candidatus Ventrimonas sp. TaxID=3048889 RepID=UPI003A1FE866